MPILTVQKRHAELGRIRLGQKVPTQSGKTRPGKLDRFRFTSPNERYIADLAQLYGGEAKAWDNGGRAEHEVITEAKSVPVVVVRGGLSQWLETWTGGGCVHRCDGYTDVLTGEPCRDGDPGHVNAKPTTRLSVMLPQLEAIGVWRLESHGWNAAAELPGVAELAQMVGELVPANLTLHERIAIKDGKTSRFVVPGLDLEVGMKRVVELANAQAQGLPAPAAAQVSGGDRQQIEAPAPDYPAAVNDATTPDELKALWRQAGESGHLSDELKAQITARVQELASDAQPTDPAPSTEGDASDRDDAWMLLTLAAGKAGMTDTELRDRLVSDYNKPVEELTADDLAAVADDLNRAGGDAA